MPRKIFKRGYRGHAMDALHRAAFEEAINKDRAAADWWRMRASLWFRREAHGKA